MFNAILLSLLIGISHIDDNVVDAVRWVESYGDDKAVSVLGARGPMQIMPGTAEYISALTGMDADMILNDVDTNVRAGTWLLSLWYNRFGNLNMALAAYYAGPLPVIECQCVPDITKHYVKKVNRVLGFGLESMCELWQNSSDPTIRINKLQPSLCADRGRKCLDEDSTPNHGRRNDQRNQKTQSPSGELGWQEPCQPDNPLGVLCQ